MRRIGNNRISEHKLEIAQKFTYLGFRLSTDNSITEEIRARMLASKISILALRICFTFGFESTLEFDATFGVVFTLLD